MCSAEDTNYTGKKLNICKNSSMRLRIRKGSSRNIIKCIGRMQRNSKLQQGNKSTAATETAVRETAAGADGGPAVNYLHDK